MHFFWSSEVEKVLLMVDLFHSSGEPLSNYTLSSPLVCELLTVDLFPSVWIKKHYFNNSAYKKKRSLALYLPQKMPLSYWHGLHKVLSHSFYSILSPYTFLHLHLVTQFKSVISTVSGHLDWVTTSLPACCTPPTTTDSNISYTN